LNSPDKRLLNQFFSATPLNEISGGKWEDPSVGFNLLICLAIKFILAILSFSLPVATGVFTPCFVIGAAFGRLYGYVLKQIFGAVINEATYSIIGAACVA